MRGIRYVSFNEASGYGEAAARSMLGLVDAGVPLTWAPLEPGASVTPGLWYGLQAAPSRTHPRLDAWCMGRTDYDVVIVHTVPEYFPEWRRREPDRFLVGLTTWETDRLPSAWPSLLECVDLLLVPCRWNREVMLQAGVSVPIEVLPHISLPIDAGGARLDLQAGSATLVFYTINTWSHRKAMPATVEAYLKAFTADDDTLLVIKTSHHDLTRRPWWRYRRTVAAALRRLQRKYRRPARIQLITDDLPTELMHALHTQGDCFLSLTRGEGWGMGAFDAARAGNQVVITGLGGPLDFLPAAHAHLLDYRHVAVAGAAVNASYGADQLWAEADVDQAVAVLRSMSRQPVPALAAHVSEHFNAEVVTRRLLGILSRHG